MKDIENFCKLYKVNIPVNEYFNYYVDCLKRAGDDKLQNYIDLYNEREKLVDNMYLDKKSYFDIVQNKIKSTKASIMLNYNDYDSSTLFKNNYSPISGGIKKYSDNYHIFISIDLVKANYQTLKRFDNENELGDSWDEFLRDNYIPEVYVQSKHFRQYVFEQSNPNKTAKFQKLIIYNLLDGINTKFSDLIENSLVFKSHDEVIFVLPVNKPFNEKLDFLININNEFINSPPRDFKVTIFKNEVLDGDKMIRTILDEHLNPINKILKGVPGNHHYMYLKKYILNEPIIEQDTLFMLEGKLAKWIDII